MQSLTPVFICMSLIGNKTLAHLKTKMWAIVGRANFHKIHTKTSEMTGLLGSIWQTTPLEQWTSTNWCIHAYEIHWLWPWPYRGDYAFVRLFILARTAIFDAICLKIGSLNSSVLHIDRKWYLLNTLAKQSKYRKLVTGLRTKNMAELHSRQIMFFAVGPWKKNLWVFTLFLHEFWFFTRIFARKS